MAKSFQRFRELLAELKRRKVYRVAAVYAAVAFVLVQAADLVFPALDIPSWAYSLIVVLALFGFPLALVLAWAFEVTPEGVRRTSEADRAETEASRPPAPRVGDRSIAVLPFRSLGDGDPGTFGEGMHDALLTRLSNVSGLKVISRTSVQQYRATEKTTAEIARELGVKWIVEGGVQEFRDQIQVNAQLIDPRTDTHRWAKSYRRDLTAEGLFDLQSDLTKKIARSLEAEISPREQKRVEERPTGSLDAYRLYLKGRQQLGRRSFDVLPGRTLRQAIDSFQRAIDRDADFAPAWAGLADAGTVLHRMRVWAGLAADPEAARRIGVADRSFKELPEPAEAARRALEIDSDLAEAHASMGFVHLENMDAPAASRALRRAVDLQPSYWEAHHWLGELYLKIGNPRRALDHISLAVELNPEHALARHWLYDAYLADGRAQESLEEARRQQEMGLEEKTALMGEVRALISLGRLQEARALTGDEVSELRVETVWGGWLRAYLVQILAADDDRTGAREYLRELQTATADPSMLAWAYAGLGEGDRALQAYRELNREAWGRIGTIVALRYPSSLSLPALEKAPGYRELLRTVNRYWRLMPDGSLPVAPESEASSRQEIGVEG